MNKPLFTRSNRRNYKKSTRMIPGKYRKSIARIYHRKHEHI